MSDERDTAGSIRALANVVSEVVPDLEGDQKSLIAAAEALARYADLLALRAALTPQEPKP